MRSLVAFIIRKRREAAAHAKAREVAVEFAGYPVPVMLDGARIGTEFLPFEASGSADWA
jgi:hypothetical protein